MMQSLSFLIENANEIHVNPELLAEYQLENALKQKNDRQYTSPETNEVRPLDTPKKYPTMRKFPPRQKTSKYSVLLTRKSKSKSRLSGAETRVQTNLYDTTLTEDITVIQKKLSDVQQLQQAHSERFTEICDEIQKQLQKSTQMELEQAREFSRLREDFASTRKELATIINMLNRQNLRERERHAYSRSSSKERAKTSRPILQYFMKVPSEEA